MRQCLMKIVFFVFGFIGALSYGDTSSSGWAWGVGCDGEGTFGNSVFTSSNSGGFSGSGTCARTSTYFTQFAFTSSSGALRSSTLYALHTGDVLVVPPTMSTDVEPIFTVQPNCPIYEGTLNWIWCSGIRARISSRTPTCSGPPLMTGALRLPHSTTSPERRIGWGACRCPEAAAPVFTPRRARARI